MTYHCLLVSLRMAGAFLCGWLAQGAQISGLLASVTAYLLLVLWAQFAEVRQ